MSRTTPRTRLLNCFVLITLRCKTKHLRSLVRAMERLEILFFDSLPNFIVFLQCKSSNLTASCLVAYPRIFRLLIKLSFSIVYLMFTTLKLKTKFTWNLKLDFSTEFIRYRHWGMQVLQRGVWHRLASAYVCDATGLSETGIQGVGG